MRVKKMPTIREVLYQYTKSISIRNIAKAFNMSKTTVIKYLNMAQKYGYNTKINDNELQEIALKVEDSLYKNKENKKVTASAMALLAPHQDLIKTWLSESSMTHSQIQRLLEKENVVVSRRSVSRFIQANLPKLPRYTIHIVTEPGKEAQVDFGYVGIMKDQIGKLRKTYVFIMTLSHSRYRYVEFVSSQNQLTWAQVHINAFEFFGGVPTIIVLDNLKSGVIKPDIYDPTLNETYSELSRFYSFAIDPTKTYTPEHKGKVERSVRIVREQLLAGKSYEDINEANIEAKKWCQEEISHRICSSTGAKPIDVFKNEEKVQLISLPLSSFDMPEWTIGKVHKDHHFVVKGNFYSVPTKYIGKEISIRIGLKTVSAYYEHRIIKTHPRNYGKGQWITDQKDYPEAVLYHLEKTPIVCLESAKSIGDATHRMVEFAVSLGTKIGLRKAQAILRLEEKYGKERLEQACNRAIHYHNYDYKAIVNILLNGIDQQVTSQTSITVIKDIGDSAYLRGEDEYVSDMEVNYE